MYGDFEPLFGRYSGVPQAFLCVRYTTFIHSLIQSFIHSSIHSFMYYVSDVNKASGSKAKANKYKVKAMELMFKAKAKTTTAKANEL